MVQKIKKVAPLTSAYNVQGVESDWLFKLRSLIYAVNKGIDNVNDLQEQATDAATRIAALTERMETAEENITSLTERMGTAEGKIGTLEEQVSELQTSLAALTERVTTNEGNIAQLQKDVIDINAAIDVINGQIEQINATLENHEGRITTNETDIAAIKNEQVTQNERLTAVEGKNDEQDGRLDTIEERASDLEENDAKQDQDIIDMQTAFSELETHVEEFHNRIMEQYEILQQAVATNSSTIASIQSQVTLLNSLYQELSGKVNEIDGDVAGNTADIVQLRSDVDACGTNIDTLTQEYEQMEAEITSLNAIKERMEDATEGYVWTSTAENPSGEWQEPTGGGSSEGGYPTPLKVFNGVFEKPIEKDFNKHMISFGTSISGIQEKRLVFEPYTVDEEYVQTVDHSVSISFQIDKTASYYHIQSDMDLQGLQMMPRYMRRKVNLDCIVGVFSDTPWKDDVKKFDYVMECSYGLFAAGSNPVIRFECNLSIYDKGNASQEAKDQILGYSGMNLKDGDINSLYIGMDIVQEV